MVNILSWNVRGAASRRCLRYFVNIVRLHFLSILIVLEPPISGERADNVCKRIGLKEYFRVEAQAFSGGIWLLWDPVVVNVEIMAWSSQLVHAVVRSNGGQEWLLTAVYGSPDPDERKALFYGKLCGWLVSFIVCRGSGDFNQVMAADEKMGRAGVNIASCKLMIDCMNYCNLVDLDMAGPKFTWSKRWDLPSSTRVKLDRAFVNHAWLDFFNSAGGSVLPRTHSDHHQFQG